MTRPANRYFRKILYWRPVRTLLHYSRLLILPGFQGIPLFDVAIFFIKGLTRGALNQRASAASFRFVIALFPLLLFFFTLLPYFDTQYYSEQIFSFLKNTLPLDIYLPIESTLNEILNRKYNGLMSIGIITSIYAASSGINAMILSFNTSQHHSIEKHKWWKRRLISMIMVVISVIGIIIVLTLLGGFKIFINYLLSAHIINSSLQVIFLKISKWIIVISMIYFAFAALYYYSLESKKGYKFFSAGASLATILFLVSTEAFILYIKFFPHYNALYGSIGVLILLFLWIYISCFSILIGFELNASISDAYKEKYTQLHSEETIAISRTAITTNPQKKVKRLINKIIIKYNKYNKK